MAKVLGLSLIANLRRAIDRIWLTGWEAAEGRDPQSRDEDAVGGAAPSGSR